MARKKSYHTDALPSLEQPQVVVVIPKGKKVIDGVEYDLVEKIPFLSKNSFLKRKPSLERELAVPFKIKQKINGKWKYVESVK